MPDVQSRISGPDPRFEDQKDKVVQILKNRNDFLAYTARDADPSVPRPHDPERSAEDSRHRMPINAEVMRRWSQTPSAVSMRTVEAELETIRKLTPFVYNPIYDMFLHPEAGDADYDRLKKQADELKVFKKGAADTETHIKRIESKEKKSRKRDIAIRELTEKRTSLIAKIPAAERAVERRAAVEMALYMLTMRLIDERLYAVFPSMYLPNKRGETMEESYRGIHRIFQQECEIHSRKMKRFRKRAYETTAELCECSVSTVERAVHFVESVEGTAA